MKNKRPQLKKYLLDYVNAHEGWIKKVDLYVIGDQIEYSAESTGRALRTLTKEGIIKCDYYNGKWVKGLAQYARLNTPEPKPPQLQIVEINGQRKAVPVGSR